MAGAAWTNGFSASTTKLIGLLEVLGEVGLVVPMLTDVLPWFTPLAVVGLALLMGGAVTLHLLYGEYRNTLLPLVVLLSIFVGHGRRVILTLLVNRMMRNNGSFCKTTRLPTGPFTLHVRYARPQAGA